MIIFVSDPEGHIETNEHTLRRLYGFTKTEARVAGLLVEGVATQDIATRLGISSGTTRWHVKHLLLKTSTVSQRQLVCLLITGVASVRFD